jgi:hypothetical protein
MAVLWALGALAATEPAGADEPQPLARGWSILRKIESPINANAVACSRTQAFTRGWSGDVVAFDGRSFSRLPRQPGYHEGKTYGTTIVATPAGGLYLGASGAIAAWNGDDWQRLEMPGWRGDIGAIAVLENGKLVVVGDGRVGVRVGDAIASHDAGTWRTLEAVGGGAPGELLTAGQGGTVMRHDGTRWARLATGSTVWLKGLLADRTGRAWVWDTPWSTSQPSTVLRYDGRVFSPAGQGIDAPVHGMAGDAGASWAIGEATIWRFDGSAWQKEIAPADLGEGYHRFVGICATDALVYVADSSGSALIRSRGAPAP